MNKRMRLLGRVAAMAVALLWCMPMKAELKAGGEYYIWLNIYEKLLGSNEAGDGPQLSAYDVNENKNGYVFIAEASGTSGYFLLKQKSSGKYLAGGDNGYSITLESKPSTIADRFRWKMTGPDCYAYLTNKKKDSNFVGINGAQKSKDYVSIFYDKRKSSHGQFSVIPVTGSSWAEARQAYESAVYTNEQGVQEIDYCQLNNKTINRSDAIDIHITSNDNPILGSSSVNLGSDRTWLIFDNIVPSDVINNYLQFVKINGVAAQKDVNCRVAIYLNGAAVIPIPSVVMSCEGTSGSFTLTVGNHKDLSTENQSNTMTSFVLRRGYMATLATGTNGQWYSRVFVADHANQVITLPDALKKRVTSVNIKPWQYVSKKGWADTKGTTRGPELRATWYWSWSAGYSSTANMEYVPCKQHRWWPDDGDVNGKTATASLSLNEPEHSEQHTSEKCSCGGTIDSWTAYNSHNKNFQAGGGRIGSPQPTDFSYLTQYFKYVDENDNHSRCDFAVTHAYWNIDGRNANDYAKYVTDQCWTIWNNTGRPVWLTEMEAGASWNNYAAAITSYDKAREYLQAMLQRLEESNYIERYAIYGFDFWRNKMFYDDGAITPAGEVYRDHRSTFAYNADNIKVPVWWADGVKTPTLDYSVDLEEQTITFTVGNGNADATDQLYIEYKPEGSSSWQTLATLSNDRNLLESSTVTHKMSLNSLNGEGGKFRVSSTTIYGGSSTSEEVTGPVFEDVKTLNDCLAKYTFGFERGEYAPYNNVEGAKAVKEAQALSLNDADFHTKVVTVCQKIESQVWTPNTVEMDAVYDGTFAHAPNNGAPAGWRMTNNTLGGSYHSRAFNPDSRLSEFNTTNSGLFLRFDGTNSDRGSMYYYGDTEGYTMPLKANTEYKLIVDFAGWGYTGKPLRLNLTGPLGFTAQSKQENTKYDADTSTNAPQRFEITFTTTSAGNYVFNFQTPGSDGNKHNVVVSNISLKRTATTESVSVGPSGYATYVSGNDLDFSGTEIKAYMAAVEGGFVVLTPINKVRAGTPVVLYYKGGNKEEAIPFASSTDTATGNQLVAGEGKAVASDGGNGVVNCILNSVGGQIGFYRANSQMVAWNRAYLPVAANATRLDIRFADETTGASLVKSEEVKSEQLFDLKGQRVSSPKKGVYIQNGKKVVK